MSMDYVVIIPAYNEERTISKLIAKTREYCWNVIVVDDGSTDSTGVAAAQAGAIVIRHAVNLGKGAALKTGCDYALHQQGKKFIVLDADGQHDPQEIPKFMAALERHDLIFGYRQMPASMPAAMRLGNFFINKTLQVLYHVSVQDSQCGYRAFTARAYPHLRWGALDYYVETEMILNAGRKKVSHSSIPIDTIYLDKYKGTTVWDGIKIVVKMIGGRLW